MMHRRDFLDLSIKSGLGLALGASPVPVWAVQRSDDAKYANKIHLLRRIKVFANEIGLRTNEAFYDNWKADRNSLYLYLYVSLPDKIVSPKGPDDDGIDSYSPNNTLSMERLKENISNGYHTMPYTTAGNSAAERSNILLSYHPASIAFIGFHEATHQHLRQNDTRLPYSFEEACCDVVANAAVKMFAQSHFDFSYRAALIQEQRTEDIYKVIVNNINAFETGAYTDVCLLYQQCKNDIQHLLPRDNMFMRTRFDYEVNNAYFLRNRLYGLHYPLLKEVMLFMGVRDFIQFIPSLPPDEAGTLKMLNEAIKK